MSDRELDVVLYGSTGFTGRQTVQYFAKYAPRDLRWAIAGRNRGKLDALLATLSLNVPVLVAGSADQNAIDAMIARTRVLLSTAGPFALYGSGIVDACVRFKTHYVDITAVADTKKAACYAHASQTPDFYYPLQDTVAAFRGLQDASKKAEAYVLQLGSPYDIFPRAGLASRP